MTFFSDVSHQKKKTKIKRRLCQAGSQVLLITSIFNFKIYQTWMIINIPIAALALPAWHCKGNKYSKVVFQYKLLTNVLFQSLRLVSVRAKELSHFR